MTSIRVDNVAVWTGGHLPDGSVFTTHRVLWRDGRIVALGDAALTMPVDEVIDGNGGFLCAGFGDGHVHPLFGGIESVFAHVRDLPDPMAIAESVGEWARAHPEAEWIRGEGFDPTVAEGGVFHATWLDAQVADRPVVLRASDYHTVWVNSEALRRAGFDHGVTQPHDGEIVLDADGFPTGTLREWGAWRPVYALLPKVPDETMVEALRTATSALASSGITWVQDAWAEPREVRAWLSGVAADVLAVHADLAQWADANSWRDQLDRFVATRSEVAGQGAGQVTAATIKFFADGVIESGTGALLEPYCDCPHSRGLPNWQPEALVAAVSAIDARGFTPHVHAIGDAAVRMALDAFEYTARVNPPRDRRWVIAHNQLIDPADRPRFAELGVIANFEPYWSQRDSWQTQLTQPRLGSRRQDRQYEMATLARMGARISFGSDWPVTTFAPLEGIQVAVTRTTPAGDGPWMPDECLTVDEALAAYTSGVAFQAGRGDAGVLRPGAVADLVLLSADPRVVDPMEIGAITVEGTWLAGSRTYGS